MGKLTGLLSPTGTLGEIAGKYDEVTTLVELDATDDLTETDLLASLLVIRALREKLLEDERRFIAAARRKKVTWARLADALKLRSRQAAERRYLQLRTDIDELNGSALTQQERIEYARDQRDRLAERAWAVNNASEIRELAERLLNVPDLQDRPIAPPAHRELMKPRCATRSRLECRCRRRRPAPPGRAGFETPSTRMPHCRRHRQCKVPPTSIPPA
ncbi:hypothetical protein [Streptomyces sp. NBC_01579]|uniref:hypothetical protein n=1 Tax=Streptomyces sp. NBC_01579 TaxID=2975885 RepID=UPI0038679703